MLKTNNSVPFSLALLIASSTLSPALAQESRNNLTPFSRQGNNHYSSSSIIGTTSISQQFPYTLDAGDVINLEIFDVPEYSKSYAVLVDGTINLPLINRLSVSGLTLQEVELLIRQEYLNQGYLRNPIVSVNLASARPITVAIVGEIRTPGSYPVPFQGSKFPDLINAIRLADGINASADTRKIQVIRQYKGREYTISVNLWDFLEQGDLNQNILLRDGDRILIPSVDNIDSTEVLRVATANFSANLSIPITVSIVGEVNRPGPYTLSGNDVRSSNLDDQLRFQNDSAIRDRESLAGIPTASRAIKTAGGLTAKADIRNVEVRRNLPSGKEQVIKVNLWKLLQTGEFRQDTLLQNGDRIFIPTAESITEDEVRQVAAASFSPNNISVSVIGEVERSGTLQLPPNVSLQQAILEAGGFDNRRAKKSTARLVRLNPNGTVTQKEIKVDFDAPLDEENNPILLNNDIIFVDRSGFAKASDTVFAVTEPLARVVSIFSSIFITIDRLDRLSD